MKRILQAALVAVLSASTSFAAPSLKLAPGSELIIAGQSTVRDFECRAKAMSANIALENDVGALSVQELGTSVREVKVVVPAKQLDCANETMNEHMRKALNVDRNETISLDIRKYEVGNVDDKGQAPLKLFADLTINGQTRPITLNASAKPDANGSLKVEGRYSLRMTDYGVTPPSLMLGTMKVRDSVVIRFQIALNK